MNDYRIEIESLAITLYHAVRPVEPKKNLRIKPDWTQLGIPLRSAFRKAAIDLLEEPLPLSSAMQALHVPYKVGDKLRHKKHLQHVHQVVNIDGDNNVYVEGISWPIVLNDWEMVP